MNTYLKFYLEAEQIFDDALIEYNLSRAALKLLFICKMHFSKDGDFISVVLLKKLDLFTKIFNFPRHLSELHKAGLLTLFPMARKNLFRISSKGQKALHVIGYSMMEALD